MTSAKLVSKDEALKAARAIADYFPFADHLGPPRAELETIVAFIEGNASTAAAVAEGTVTRAQAAAYLREADDVEFLETLAAAGEHTAPAVLELMQARRLLFALLSSSGGSIMCSTENIAKDLKNWFEKETARRAPSPIVEDFCP